MSYMCDVGCFNVSAVHLASCVDVQYILIVTDTASASSASCSVLDFGRQAG